MAHVKTYAPQVKNGNWREDEIFEEEKLNKFLLKMDKGELCHQKVDLLKQNLMEPVNLSAPADGYIHFGDIVMLVNVCNGEGNCFVVNIDASLTTLLNSPIPCLEVHCGISASQCVQPSARTAFVVTSVDGSPDGSTLCYNQSFALKTLGTFAKDRFLTSDMLSYRKHAKKSHLQSVYLDKKLSFLTWWRVVHVDPQERLENEGLPVPTTTRVLIVHCKTNQALAVLGDHVLWNSLGKEYEVTAHTFYNCYRVEEENNVWHLTTADPSGNCLALVNRKNC